jgi:hypothetical protein
MCGAITLPHPYTFMTWTGRSSFIPYDAVYSELMVVLLNRTSVRSDRVGFEWTCSMFHERHCCLPVYDAVCSCINLSPFRGRALPRFLRNKKTKQ